MAGRSISITLVCATLVLTAALHAGGQHGSTAAQAGALELVSSTQTRFPVSAAPLTDLYPGSARAIAPRVTNPYSFAIRVTKLVVTIRRATDHADCLAAGNLVVLRQYSGKPFTVRPHHTVTVGKPANRPLLQMPAAAQQSCQGATFRVHFKGRAVKR
jgi:hypothetical protein